MKWQPSPVFLSEKFHGQRSLVGSSPWGRMAETEHSTIYRDKQRHPYYLNWCTVYLCYKNVGGDELRKKDLAGQGSGEKVEKYCFKYT